VKTTLKVSLKANERIYVNGAVIRVDRKTSMEFLNDVSFLLENHIMQSKDADTPLKQLYYLVQILLIEPDSGAAVFSLYRSQMNTLLATLSNKEIAAELKNIDRLVHENCLFEAMRTIRRISEQASGLAIAANSDADDAGLQLVFCSPQRSSGVHLATGEG
jgi:flagellar biosynthesis repressor protein FlbT